MRSKTEEIAAENKRRVCLNRFVSFVIQKRSTNSLKIEENNYYLQKIFNLSVKST